MAKLDAREAVFVQEYLIDLDPVRAARAAGYSASTAKSKAFCWVSDSQRYGKPHVLEAIRAAMKSRAERTAITADRVLEEIANIGLLDPIEIVGAGGVNGPEDIAKLPEHVRRAIAGWSWDRDGRFTLKIADKLTALDKMARHLGMFAQDDASKAIADLGALVSQICNSGSSAPIAKPPKPQE